MHYWYKELRGGLLSIYMSGPWKVTSFKIERTCVNEEHIDGHQD